MNARAAVLQIIHEDDGNAVSEDVIYDKLPDSEHRTVNAALQGLADAGVIHERRVFGGEPFWYIDRNVGKEELEQALTSVGTGEVAEKIMEQSSMFGDPLEARKGGDDVWENLL